MEEERPLKDHVFVFTGEMDLPRDEARNLAVALGARVTTAVSGKTTHLVVGSEPGASKVAKAKELKVRIINAEEFAKMINDAKEVLEAVITTDINDAHADPATQDAGRRSPAATEQAHKDEYTDSEEFRAESATPSRGARFSGMNAVAWAEKYRPRSIDELVGNPGVISQLDDFLRGKVSQKAVLLSGPPGIGKTTAALVLCRQHGLEPVELNASDCRNKSSLDRAIGGLADRLTVGRDLKIGRKVLIMDEVDGMTSDRGGIPELVKIIKKTRIPFVCICNDHMHPKMRTLANHCLDLRFRKLDSRSILPRIKHVLHSEGKQLNDPTINEIILRCGGDMRYTLNTLQSLVSKDTTTAHDIMRVLNTKNVTKGPFELVSELFKRHKAEVKIDLYFEDYGFLPLFVHENYIKCKMSLDALNHAADSISFSDVQDARIHGQSQDWALMPHHAFSSCVYPTRGLVLSSRIDFPVYLGQMSKQGRNSRILAVLQNHCKFKIGSQCWRYLAMPLLNAQFIHSISRDDAAACVGLLVETELLKEDLLAVNTLVDDSYKLVPTKYKTMLTRECKKIKRVLPYALDGPMNENAESDE